MSFPDEQPSAVFYTQDPTMVKTHAHIILISYELVYLIGLWAQNSYTCMYMLVISRNQIVPITYRDCL